MNPKLGFALLGAGLLATGVSSLAIAAQPQASTTACYSACPSQAAMTMSSHVVTFGQEQTAVFRVTVRSSIIGVHGRPRGTVAVTSRSLPLCTIELSRGTGECSPGPTALPPRRRPYIVKAHYYGDGTYHRSTSPVQPLWVFPR